MVMLMTLMVTGSVFGYLQYREGQTFLPNSPSNETISVVENNASQSGGLSESSSAAEKSAKITVTIYNGTSTRGLAKEVQDKLKVKFASPRIESGSPREVGQMNFVGVGNTTGDFAKTIVVDLSGKNGAAAKMITGEINGQVVDKFPEGEIRPESDILIIIGSDYAR